MFCNITLLLWVVALPGETIKCLCCLSFTDKMVNYMDVFIAEAIWIRKALTLNSTSCVITLHNLIMGEEVSNFRSLVYKALGA